MRDEPISVTDAAVERALLQADRPVVAVFWKRGETDPARLQDVLEAAAREYAGQARLVRLEAGDAPQSHRRFDLDTLPQFLFFREGQVVARARGLPSPEALRPWIEYLLGRGPAPARRVPGVEPAAASAHPVAVTDADFDRVVLGSRVPVLVDFWAAWCGPCRTIAPVVERLAAAFAGRAVVAKLDVEANRLTAQRYGAMSIPTLVFFQDGREVDRLVGVHPEAVLSERLAALL